MTLRSGVVMTGNSYWIQRFDRKAWLYIGSAQLAREMLRPRHSDIFRMPAKNSG